MNADELRISLDRLLNVLIEKESPLVPRLKEGIERDYINDIIKQDELIFPEELYTYYGWRNGFSIGPDEFISMATVTLFTLGNPIPIETSLEEYFEYSFINGYWDKKYFPLFESGIGDYYLIDLDPDSPNYKMIMFFSPATPYFQGVISFSDSFQKLIYTITECYERKYYFFEEFEGNRVFGATRGASFELWKQNNPKSEYWRTLGEFR